MAPGGTCTIDVGGRAAEEGENTATLIVTSTDGVTRHSTVRVTGNTAPTVEITQAPSGLTTSRDATITFTATDDGRLDVSCALDGATAASCSSPYVLSGLSDGQHSVVVTVTDSLGQTATDTVSWTVDASAPVLSVPSGVSVNATTPAGAVVEYQASAADTVDPDVPVSCEPASGATFAIGDTTVTCSATDDAGNSAAAAFVVHVAGAGEQVTALQDEVKRVDMPTGTRYGLLAQLQRAREAIRVGNRAEACAALADFSSYVRAQSGKKIATADADSLLAAAQQPDLGRPVLLSDRRPPRSARYSAADIQSGVRDLTR